MAATVLLAPGTTDASSSDFTVAAGGSVLVYLTDSDGGALPSGVTVAIEVKDGSNYYPLDTLRDDRRGLVVQAPTTQSITCRVTRAGKSYSSVGASYQ